MSLTVEFAFLPINTSTDLSSGDAAKVWQDSFLKTVSSQPGCHGVYWGRQIERPGIVQFVAEWDSYDAHQTFRNSPAYEPMLVHLRPLLEGDVTMYHIPFPAEAPFSLPASSAVTECISLFFEPSHPTADYDANWAKFVELASKEAAEAKGVAGGWAMEEQRHKLGKEAEEEVPARLFGGFIGWPSVDAHMKFREQKEFGGVIKYLRDGPKALQVHHVELKKV